MNIKSLYIENFRNFGDEGVYINLSPITFFTGCNSAGKSSATKAFLLLNSYLSDVKANNYNLIKTPLDFSKIVKLGNFDTVLNKTSKEIGVNNIVLGYSWASAILTEDIQVKFSFIQKTSDSLNNGWLNEMLILVGSTELLSINIIDNHYSIEILNYEKFIEYYRFFMLKQAAGRIKDYMAYRCCIDPYATLNDVSTNDSEKIVPEAKELLELEKSLIKSGLIREQLWSNDFNKDIREYINVTFIKSILLDVIDFNKLDSYIYSQENINKRKFSHQDLDGLKDFIDSITIKDYENDDVISLEEYNNINILLKERAFKRKKESLISYFESESLSYIEFINKNNVNYIKSLINCLNSDKDIDKSLFHFINILNSLSVKPIAVFIIHLVKEVLNPDFCGRMGYADASTVDVKRLYPLDTSDKFGNLWKKYNDKVLNSSIPSYYKKGDFIKKWLREFDICSDILVENIEGALRIKLISAEYPEGRLLADYGYGITQLISLLLNIEIALSNIEVDHVTFAGHHPDADFYYSNTNYYLIIEEPEVHLHPNYQSKLADLFMDAYSKGVHFIIETHSEYMIRRTQVLTAEKGIRGKNAPFKVYYFPSQESPYDMEYQKNGKFLHSFGPGFLDVADNAALELFDLGENFD